MLDYETDLTTCVATVTLRDGAISSDPLTLRINVQDVNEPPRWTAGNGDYVLSLSEHSVRVPKYHCKHLTQNNINIFKWRFYTYTQKDNLFAHFQNVHEFAYVLDIIVLY